MEKLIFNGGRFGNTEFVINEGQVNISTLFGMPMFAANPDAPRRIRGITDMDFEPDGEIWEELTNTWEKTDNGLKLWFFDEKSGMELLTEWEWDEALGILSRRDYVTNKGNNDVTLYNCWPRFVFSPDEYECYVQNSTWCYEDKGGWEKLGRCGVFMQSEGGRTTQGGTPFLGIRSAGSGRGVAFHIVPKGNWEIRMQRGSAGVGPQGSEVSILRLGQSKDHFAVKLVPGQRLELPQLLIQGLPEGKLYKETAGLQGWLAQRHKNKNQCVHKVVYNPWYSCYDHIKLSDMLRYAKTASDIGCEVFEVDAGWYGQGADWGCCVGDWREKQDGAFFGKLKEFADQIRSLGMGFGLWMEPKRAAANAPARREHPDWFLKGNGGCYYPKLWEPEPYAYIKGEMVRLIEAYNLVWMKIDFNFEFEEDTTRSQYLFYYENWYRMIDEIKELHPEVFIEGCASGGLRSDINTMQHFDGHFICDNVNPFDGQSMFEQRLMRTFPNKIYQWMAVQKGADIPAYFRDVSDVEKSVIVPSAPGAGFGDHERMDLDFLCKLMFRGMVGITGDITTLEKEDLDRMKAYIGFYKKFRPMLAGSRVSIDTEPTSIGERDNWRVLVYDSNISDEHLIYIYRFGSIQTVRQIYPKNLVKEAYYLVKRKDTVERVQGETLEKYGIEVRLPGKNSGEIIYICPDADLSVSLRGTDRHSSDHGRCGHTCRCSDHYK